MAFDRGVAAVPEAAEAREHCRSCPECRAFVEGLGMLEKIPPPIAPPYLVEDIVERSRRMAAANVPPIVGRKPDAEPADDLSSAEETAPAPVTPVALAPVARPSWTAGRVTALAAAVLVGVFAISMSVQGFRALRGPKSAPTASIERLQGSSPDAAKGGYEAAPQSAPTDRAAGAATAGGARYVAFEGQAYFWLGARTPEGDTLVPVGTLISALESTATPDELQVWRSKSDGDVIFLRPDETAETYVAFRRATRSVDGKVFALYADRLEAYGLWPALPSQYETPTATDGFPTFTAAGKDDAGLEIYAPAGGTTAAGFAVAPNTSPGDPAGGNPNWTWWIPKP